MTRLTRPWVLHGALDGLNAVRPLLLKPEIGREIMLPAAGSIAEEKTGVQGRFLRGTSKGALAAQGPTRSGPEKEWLVFTNQVVGVIHPVVFAQVVKVFMYGWAAGAEVSSVSLCTASGESIISLPYDFASFRYQGTQLYHIGEGDPLAEYVIVFHGIH